MNLREKQQTLLFHTGRVVIRGEYVIAFTDGGASFEGLIFSLYRRVTRSNASEQTEPNDRFFCFQENVPVINYTCLVCCILYALNLHPLCV